MICLRLAKSNPIDNLPAKKMRSKYNRFKHEVVKCLKYGINALFIKNRRKLFFDSFPDYSDNSRAFSDYLLTNGYTPKYKIYWAVNAIPEYKDERVHYVLKKDKKRYIYHTLTSHYLFSTHGAFNWCNPHLQRFVCFFHGSALKKFSQMLSVENDYYLEQAWKFTAPSDFYVGVYAQAFGRKAKDVLLSGYPRCDLLFQSNDSLKKAGIELKNDTKIVVYMPTFRKPVSVAYKDSNKNVFEEDFIIFSDPSNLERWNSFFQERHVILIVKPHPSESNVVKCDRCSNIKVLTNHDLQHCNVQLYSLLANADALITDYSSVSCDYLLLDRPMGFVVTDFEEYKQGRGFVFDDPLGYMPGSIISKESEFVEFFNDLCQGEDKTKEKRDKLKLVFNKYSDGKNCERIAEAIGLRR